MKRRILILTDLVKREACVKFEKDTRSIMLEEDRTIVVSFMHGVTAPPQIAKEAKDRRANQIMFDMHSEPIENAIKHLKRNCPGKHTFFSTKQGIASATHVASYRQFFKTNQVGEGITVEEEALAVA